MLIMNAQNACGTSLFSPTFAPKARSSTTLSALTFAPQARAGGKIASNGCFPAPEKLLQMARPGPPKNCFKCGMRPPEIASHIACNGGSWACKMTSNFPCLFGGMLAISQAILVHGMKYYKQPRGASFQRCMLNFNQRGEV